MTDGATHTDAVATSYAGFATDDETYLVEVIQCEPSGVDDFAREYGDALNERRAISEHLVPVGAWRTVCGPADEITHVYAFPSLASLETESGDLLLDQPMPDSTAKWQRSRSVRLARKVPYGTPLVDIVAGA